MSPHHRTQRPSFRCTAIGVIGAIALGLVAMSPVAHVSAADGNGALVFSARLCPTVAASENFTYECDPIDPGAVTFVSWDGVTTLGMDSAVNVNGILNWHAPNISVPLTDYHVDVTGLAVPDGYELWNIVPGQGEGGGSEFGWYASLTEESPETDLYALYVPDGGPDSDGDGASDSSEIAFGSDPYDPSSYPEVQAGPEGGPSAGPSDADDSDGDGVGDLTETNAGTDPYDASSFPAVQAGPEPAESTGTSDGSAPTVLQLPNTGSGAASGHTDAASVNVLLALGAAMTALGGFVGIRRRA